MNCPRCGEICRCHLEPLPAASARGRSDAEAAVTSVLCPSPASDIEKAATEPSASDARPQEFADKSEDIEIAPQRCDSEEQDNAAWRDELSARLNRYRARRKMRPPRYPSLRLQFDAATPVSEPVRSYELPIAPISFEPMSHQALALDGTLPPSCEMESPETAVEAAPVDHPPVARLSATHTGTRTGARTSAYTRAKIIEFPRFAFDQVTFEPPASPPDQLAEPVNSRPRILEVPEIEQPPPALGGITIEPTQRLEAEKRIGIDVPLQSASLAKRILASLIDSLIVGAASSLFGYIFWKVTAIRPPLVQILGMAAGVSFVFWAAYQYLLLVYAASTPGVRAAGLDLVRFDGTPTSRSLRRWRVLASYLSAASLGLGYVWVFLDEDVLCWHDRITHTFLAPRKRGTEMQ